MMKLTKFNNRLSKFFLLAGLIVGIVSPSLTMADNVRLSEFPLATASKSNVLPNLMFLLDNSGSMAQNYTPDWVCDGTLSNGGFTICPYTNDTRVDRDRFINPQYNTQFYNPEIRYSPAVKFDGSSYGDQTNFGAVKNDFTDKQATGTSNLVGSAVYNYFVAGEYCDSLDLTNCIASSAPSGTYKFPAPIRWCNSADNATTATPATAACQKSRVGGFTFIRVPSSKATVTFSGAVFARVTSLQVNGQEILSAQTNSTSSNTTMATNVANRINACSNYATGNCSVGGFFAIASGSTVTIFDQNGGLASGTAISVTRTGTLNSAISTWSQAVPGSLSRVSITTGNTYALPGSTAKDPDRTDCAGTVCTYTEEMTNYANWWAYYRTRMQGMKSAASQAFSPIDSRYRVGFFTINNSTNNYLAINTFSTGSGGQKDNWYSRLFSIVPGNATPLREALGTVGRIFAGVEKTNYGDPMQYACQQNYVLMTTDGYWNGSNPNSSNGGLDIKGAYINTNVDGNDGTPFKDASSGTLADVARYYFKNDIRDSNFGNCTGATGGDVCGDAASDTLQQNMVTMTLGLGIDGTLTYQSDYKTATSGDYYDVTQGKQNWPDPISNNTAERIDDLWHAAVNGDGTYFSASNPKQLTNSLIKALNDIQSKLGTGTGAAASTLQPVSGNNTSLVPTYNTVIWTGNVEGRQISTTDLTTSQSASWAIEDVPPGTCPTGQTVRADSTPNTGKFFCVTANASASTCTGTMSGTDCLVEANNPNPVNGKLKTQVSANSDSRKITINVNGALQDFTYSNLPTSLQTYFQASTVKQMGQWPVLSTTQQSRAVGNNLVNYLRGQYGLEMRDSNAIDDQLFRWRQATLGDITESQPAFLVDQSFNYSDTGYAAFKASQATSNNNRFYVGANDGMMHMFYASGNVTDTNNGTEVFAFIPTPVIPNLWRLADRDYGNPGNHRNFVNGDPIIGDVLINGSWRTILVSGLAGGGRGYFALDITDPSASGTKLLWEVTASSSGMSNLGYTYGNPIITKTPDGKWVVLVTSGYDNGTYDKDGTTLNTPAGDGGGWLFVLDVATGSVLKKFPTGVGTADTPSGLGQISAYIEDLNTNNTTQYVYGGDLLGNVWRFDLTAADGSKPLQFATLKGPAGNAQPITTKPSLGNVNGNRMVFIGTGKYLEDKDLTDKSVQTIYAIMDKNDGNALGNPRSLLVSQTMTVSGNDRFITSPNKPNYNTQLGWMIDLNQPTAVGERQNVDALLVNGVLFFATLVPSPTDCSPGGTGWFNAVDYSTGAPVPTLNNMMSNKVFSPIQGLSLLYDSQGKSVVGYNTKDDGAMQQNKLSKAGQYAQARSTILNKNSNGTYGTRRMWRELTK